MGSSAWIECELADVCSSVDYGYTAAASDHSTGPRFLRITDIVQPLLGWDTVPHVEADEVTLSKYRLDDGDIVLARTGASTGASAYIQDPPEAIFASYLVRLKIKPSVDPRFVSYYLKSDTFWSYIRGVLGDKSAQPNASASTMVQAPFRAPRDIAEQRRISGILGALDDKIELNRRLSQTLESMARALFKSWFVDFDINRADAVEAGWRVGHLGDVAELLRKTENPIDHPTDTYMHFSLPAFDAGQRPVVETGRQIKSLKFQVPPDAVLVSKLNPEIERVWLVDAEPADRSVCSTEFMVLRARKPHGRAFLYCLARSPGFRTDLESLVTGTSKSHQRVQADSLLGIATIIPPSSLGVELEERSASLLEQASLCARESRSIDSIRTKLLPRLLADGLRQ